MPAPDDLQAFATRWRELAPELRAMERSELQRLDIAATMRAFAGAALAATHAVPEAQPASSGLVEFHLTLRPLRR